jgi:cytochrome b involved in lipid metabolism
MSSGKQYTWKDVAEHNTEKSCWVAIDKKVYDITNFLEKHPGGKEYLLLAAGIPFLFLLFDLFSLD